MKEELNETYKYDEIIQKVLDYFDGDELASNVWIQKYSLKNNKGEILEQIPTETHKRMAKEFARIENKYRENRSEYTEEIFKSLSKYGQNRKKLSEEKIFEYFDKFKYIVPQGSVMASLGNPYNYSSLSNCIVIPEVYDSYGGIMFADQQLSQLMKRRCGVGVDISTLRPKYSEVSNAALSSTGAISFMERFSNTTREVAQDGRRGALMITCFAPDTFVLTDYGWDKIINVIEKLKSGQKIKAWTHEGFRDIIDSQEFDEKEIYEIEAENGKTIKVTADHKFVVRNIETKEEYLKAIIDVNPEKEELIFYMD